MNRTPRVLVACEFSGTVRSAFEQRGWEAWSCDLLDTDIPTLFHHKGDIRDIVGQRWDLVILHPPCTFLVTSGNRWFYHPDDTVLPVEFRRPHPLYPNRLSDRKEAIEFVQFLWGQKHTPHMALENPLGILPGHIGKYSQIVHPYQFGHDVSKSTCLWLKGLPCLVPTKQVPPRITEDGKMRWGNQVDASGSDKTSPGPNRWKIRSKTYTGIARAMANQWGSYIENKIKT